MKDLSYQPYRSLPKGGNVLLAFSGGVDSTIAAHFCRENGFQPLAVNMRLLKDAPDNSEKVQAAADALGIELKFLDLQDDFEQTVMRYCWEEYRLGRTPNPCAVCNPMFKFGRLMEYGKAHGCVGMMTGHYARILSSETGEFVLARGLHRAKDQSYFMCCLTQEQLAFSYMPLGAMTKDEVRIIARSLNLPNADDAESQDACFAPRDGSPLAEKLRKLFHDEIRSGDFVDAFGRVLGHHCGIHSYTIGQRKGTGVALGKPAYVQRICAADSTVVLTSDSQDLFEAEMHLYDPNWMLKRYESLSSFEADVQIRYRSKPAPAVLYNEAPGHLKVVFREPQRAITPGQAAVVYQNDIVVCGAWIGGT